MAAPPEVMARLGCARMLLLRSKGTPQHAIVSRLQADAVIDLMQRQAVAIAAMSTDMRARMAALAIAGAWHPTDLANIMKLLHPPAPKQTVVRAQMHKFTPNILHYFTAAEWEQMRSRQQSLGVAVDFLIGRLHQLGGICLSEPCKAWCSSLLLSLHGMANSTESTRKQVLVFFKAEYARRGRKATKVEPFLLELPQPAELKAKHPQLHYSVFGDTDPVPSQIDIGLADLPRVSCRSTSKYSQALEKAQFAMDSSKEQPGEALPMKFLEQIVTLQKDNLQLIKDSVLGQKGLPQSLVALTSQPPAPFQSIVQGCLALTAAPASVADPSRDVRLGEFRGFASLGEPSQQASLGVPTLGLGEPSQQANLGVPRLAIDQGEAFPAQMLESQDTQECGTLAVVQLPTPPLCPEPESMPASSSTPPAASTALATASSADSCLAQQILRQMGAMNDANAAGKKVAGGSAANKAPKKKAAPKKQAAIADTGVEAAPKKKAAPKKQAALADIGGGEKRKFARVDHEASRLCWRARFPDKTSKGFKYKSGDDPEVVRKQAEEYVKELGFEVVD